MDINASLIDQRVQQLASAQLDALAGDDAKLRNDPPKLASRAFTALCVQAQLDVPLSEAFDYITDASHDLAIDALHVDDVRDGEFLVTLFQAKYRRKLDGQGAFPANDVLKVVQTVGMLFDPNKAYDQRTPLAAQVEEIRSLVREGALPTVRVVLCNNGQPWMSDAQAHIDAAGFSESQVAFEHLNHTQPVSLLRTTKPVDHALQLTGKAIIEGFNFRRVLVGKMRVSEVADLLEQHGERLLERNIRRYLGLRNNLVNQAIASTLRDPEKRSDFYFFNNGLTLTCQQFRHNNLQGDDHKVRVKRLQIINGGQTCVTIQRVLADLDPEDFNDTFVIVRLYELEEDDHEIVRAITYATNSQNPVDLRDLHANDPIQLQLESGLQALGYSYLRKRGMPEGPLESIRPQAAAEAVMAILRRLPHVARFQRKTLFGHHYPTVFTPTLTPAQVAFAVHIRRGVKALIRRGVSRAPLAGLLDPPRWLPYAELTLAMLVGDALNCATVDHRTFAQRIDAAEAQLEAEYRRALDLVDLEFLLNGINTNTESLQRLSALFRRPFFEDLEGLEKKARLIQALQSIQLPTDDVSSSALVGPFTYIILKAGAIHQDKKHQTQIQMLSDLATRVFGPPNT